jgi:uncharacterized protein (TIGR01244 family)
MPRSGLIVGGQPTEEQLSHLAANGLSRVVDLRGEDEDRGLDERAVAESLGLEYVAIPIPDRASLNWTAAAELNALLSSDQGTVLVHCRSGNRAGAVFALSASLDGESSVEAALEIGRAHGLTSLEEHVLPLLESGPPIP